MNKIVILTLILTLNFVSLLVSNVNQTVKNDSFHMYPFSFEEVEAIPSDFTLMPPQYLLASDKCKLAYYSFIPANPRACMILFPGAGLYGNKMYQYLAYRLQKELNVACFVIDLRGHGYSEGIRGDAPTVQQMWEDIDSIITHAKSSFPALPLYAIGHSSGGGLLINYNSYGNHVNNLDGYIFLAPYLGPNSGAIRNNLDGYSSFVKKLYPWVYLINLVIPLNYLQHLTAVEFNYPQEIITNDPLIVSSYTYAISCATTPYDVKKLFAALKRPFALYIGQEDEQFIPEKIIEFKELAHLVKNNSTATIIPNARHLSIVLDAPKLIGQWLSLQKY